MARIIARATCTLVSPFAALLRPAPRPWIELFVAQFDAANLLCRPRNEARGPAFAKTEFATDSPLEGDGFELPVPHRAFLARCREIAFDSARRVRSRRERAARLAPGRSCVSP